MTLEFIFSLSSLYYFYCRCLSLFYLFFRSLSPSQVSPLHYIFQVYIKSFISSLSSVTLLSLLPNLYHLSLLFPWLYQLALSHSLYFITSLNPFIKYYHLTSFFLKSYHLPLHPLPSLSPHLLFLLHLFSPKLHHLRLSSFPKLYSPSFVVPIFSPHSLSAFILSPFSVNTHPRLRAITFTSPMS